MSGTLDYAVEQALIASRIVGRKNSYVMDNTIESKLVIGYLKGGPKPSSPVATAMGRMLVALEDARRASPSDPTDTARTYAEGTYGKGSYAQP